MKGNIQQGNPMLKALLLCAGIAVLGVWALSMAACDLLDSFMGNVGTKTGSDNPNSSDSSVSVTGVTLDLATLSLVVEGKTPSLNATVEPGNATNKKVTWASSNSGVATVSDGKVTAVSAGSAVIAVATEDGGKTASCAVTVYAKGTDVLTGTVTISMADTSGTAKTGTPYVGYTLKAETGNLDGNGTISYQLEARNRQYRYQRYLWRGKRRYRLSNHRNGNPFRLYRQRYQRANSGCC